MDVEGGALGVAIHTRFFGGVQEGGENAVFIYCTTTLPDGVVIRLSRFALAGTEEQRLNSEEILIEQQRKDNGFHNAGALFFDDSGFLFLSIGNLGDSATNQQLRRDAEIG